MSGHNKFSKIKHQKAATDAKKSQVFSKYSRLITSESKKVKGDINSPSLTVIIEKARKENMPKDVIERAVKKGTESGAGSMESITYEAYGPGGSAIIIEALTDNRNKAAQEVKFILSKNGSSLAGIGAASWAFEKKDREWLPKTTVNLEDADIEKLEKLVDELEANEDVQAVFTNAE
jgi:YebC/PmpR family DNA-binding regulatory protein